MYFLNKIKRKLSNSKGSAVIEFGIGLMLFVMLLAFTIELLFVGNKRFNIGQETTDIARVLAKQGGVLKQAPQGYPGGEESYLNSQELLSKIEGRMLSADLGTYTEGVWKVTLTEYDKKGNILREGLLTPSTYFDVDYMHSLDVRIEADYNWVLMKSFLGDTISKTTVGAKRHAVSEFKYDFDKWEGEEY